jgi:hypothetical protein
MTRDEALALKPGDLIKCIDASGTKPWAVKDPPELEVDKYYTVMNIRDDRPYGVIIIEENQNYTFSHERFTK